MAHARSQTRGPPALYLELERERTKEEKEREEVLHLFRCYTHTQRHTNEKGQAVPFYYGHLETKVLATNVLRPQEGCLKEGCGTFEKEVLP